MILEKMMNKQKLSYKILEEKIPISKNLLNYLKKNNLKKLILYLMVMIIRFYLQLVLINLESFNTSKKS